MQEVVDPEDSTKTYSVPVYRITASLKCKNANCPLANKMLSVTGRSDRKLTGNDKQNNYVEVTVAHTPNTCEEPGKTVYTAAAGFFDKDQAITFEDRSDTLSRTDVKLATGHDYEFTWVWKGTTADGKTDVTVTDENEADIVAYTAAALTRTCKNDPKDSKTIEAEKVDVTKDPANAEDVSCTQGVIAYYDAEVTFDKTETDPGTKYADRKVIVKEALGHKYGWIINEDWESISGETTGVKAYYGCMNKIPEDVWTNDTGKYNDYNIQDVNIVKNTAQSSEPTCSTKGATVWDLQVADGTVIGSHEQTIDIVPTAHKAQGAVTIQWETLKAIDRDANGKVIFSVKGKRACAYGNHTLDIEGRATAELGSFSCGEAATVECTFDFGTGIEVEGGQKQPLTIEAAGHDLEFVEGTEEKVCGQPYYPDHFRCKKCGKAFLNPSPNSETVISTTANLPHGFGTPVFSWIEQGKTAQAVFTCANCGTTRQFTADVGSQLITKRPTCQTTGTAYYPVDLYLTSLEDKSGFSADYYPGNVIETLPVIGHEFDSEGNCIYGCGKKSEDIVNVIYVNGLTDNVIRDTWIQRSTAAAYEIQAAPNQFGYDLAGWRFNNTSYASTQKTKLQTDVRTAITNTETNEIRIYVQYTAAEKSATVNVYQVVNGTAGQTPIRTISDLTVGQAQLLSADEAVGGAVFSHWAADDKGIQVLSVSRNYNLFISGEGKKNVYAIYVTNPDEEMDQKRIVISDVYTSQIDGADKLSFVSAMSMPEGATWVSSGFMYSTSSTFGTDKEVTDPEVIAALTVGSTVDGVKQKALTGRTANVLTINLGVNNSTNKGRDVWVRGYLFYEDSEGNLHECYTDVVKTNYTTVKTQEEN